MKGKAPCNSGAGKQLQPFMSSEGRGSVRTVTMDRQFNRAGILLRNVFGNGSARLREAPSLGTSVPEASPSMVQAEWWITWLAGRGRLRRIAEKSFAGSSVPRTDTTMYRRALSTLTVALCLMTANLVSPSAQAASVTSEPRARDIAVSRTLYPPPPLIKGGFVKIA